MRSASAKQMGLTEEIIDEGIENYKNSDQFTDAEKIAIQYSELMGTTPEKIDASFYSELKKHYSIVEIVELGAFIGFNIGYHTFFGTLDFYPMFTPEGELVSQEVSKQIYGPKPVSLTQHSKESVVSENNELKTA